MNVPPAYGYLDYVQTSGPDLHGSGWLLLLDGPFDSIELLPAAGPPIAVECYENGPLGAAVPHVPRAAQGGFRFRVPNVQYDEEGLFRALLVGKRGGQARGSMTIELHRPARELPFPPDSVLRRATGNTGHAFWFATGMKDCNDFRRCLSRHLDLDAVRTLLDWGCGAGRVTRHLIDRFPEAVVHGHDIDQEAVEWAGNNLHGRFSPCTTEPPLPHAGDTFDLVISLSVFTHLTRDYQARWLTELRRILKPGGLLLATTHGKFAGRWLMPNPKEFDRVFATGFHDAFEDHNLGHVASGKYYKSTYQSYEYTREAWSPFLDFVDFVEGGCHNLQDIFVWRKPA